MCREMRRQGLDHGHRVLRYRIRMKSGRDAPYRPAIAVNRGPILFLVEPCETKGAVDRATRFLDQHSPEIVFVAVAPKRLAAMMPPESYDELYADGDVPRLVRRIREQDPEGAVRLFRKRR